MRTAQCVSCLLTKWVITYDDPAAGDAEARVVEALREVGHALTCAACIAFMTELPLPEARRVIDLLSGRERCRVREGSCDVCGRWQPVVRAVRPL